MDYEVIDNFLPEHEFEEIKTLLLSGNIGWFYRNYVAKEGEKGDQYYFTHTFYLDDCPTSSYYPLLLPVRQKIGYKACFRIKGNLYPNVRKQVKNPWHVDFDFPHKGAVYYINTNNGYTELEDGSIVESKENRILLFDSSRKHRSVQCTDQKCRVTINFNYF